MNDLIAFSIFAVLTTALIVDDLRIRRKRHALAQQLLQQTLDKVALIDRIEKLSKDSDNKTIEQTEGFLKFVSDSRDWAFKYIEDVQVALGDFDKKVAPILEYYSTYGTAVSGLHTEITKEISEAYAELKMVLPQEESNI